MKLFSTYSLIKLLVGVAFILSIASIYAQGTTPALMITDYFKAVTGTGDLAIATMNSSSMVTRGMFDNGIFGLFTDAGDMLGIDTDPMVNSFEQSGLNEYIDTIEDLSGADLSP